MFEDINQHRAAVAENIQKAMEIGFTGNELEKAHQEGDVHPNGKWVWTKLPSGKYDWRVIKNSSSGGAGKTAPKAGESSAQQGKKKEISKVDKKTEEIKGFINILKQTPNERHFEFMEDDELKRFRDTAHNCSLDSENLNKMTRDRCAEWRDLAKQEIASRSKAKSLTDSKKEKKEDALDKIKKFDSEYKVFAHLKNSRIPEVLSNHTFSFSEEKRKKSFPFLENTGTDDQEKAIKYVFANAISGGMKEVAKKLNESNLGYQNWKAVSDNEIESTDSMGNTFVISITKKGTYSQGDKITADNVDGFAKLVNSRKQNIYITDTAGGKTNRVARIISVRPGVNYSTVNIHWMGNGENEKKEFYTKTGLAQYLNKLALDFAKK